MPPAEPFTFGIPLIARAATANWPLVEALLDLTLTSVRGQTDSDFRIVIAGHDRPETAPDDTRTTFIAADWPAGLYPVYLTVGDPAAQEQFHQSLEFIPIAGQLRLELKSDKKGYRLGEQANFTLTGSSGAPWDGTLSFGVYDFRGRLLATANQPAAFRTSQPQQFEFRATMADHGVRVDTLWAEVVARKGAR